MGGIIEVAGVSGGEQSEVHLRLAIASPSKCHVSGKVEGGYLDNCWKPVSRDLAIHGQEFSWPFLVLPSSDTEKGVED